jgi:hypothetical protein
VAVGDYGQLAWTVATILAWASLVALGIAWDAHVKFRILLDTPRLDELHMPPVWERRSHRWRSIGLVTFGVGILFFVAWTTVGAVP